MVFIDNGGRLMTTFQENLEKYAELAVRVGIHVQPGQTLVISATISAAEFVRLVAKKAYEAGAKNVHVEWTDDELERTKFALAPDDAFHEYPLWKAKGFEEMAQNGAGFLNVAAPNPDLLQGISPERIATSRKATSLAMHDHATMTRSGRVSWSVVAVPTAQWAKKVFPDLSEDEGMKRLWEAVFMANRVDTTDPVSAWKEHVADLNTHMGYLNTKQFKKLLYRSPGTELSIELPNNHRWVGGGLHNQQGVFFMPNLPTEEVFTMPLKTGVDGVVTSTMPLNYGGQTITEFSLTFKRGKIVDFSAKQGSGVLEKLIQTDEGANHLGEVALVPVDSPISNLNVIFHNTLFDENASCHLAMGNAYPLCVDGGTTMTKEEFQQAGGNISLTHVDFMIGSRELDIDGVTASGSVEPIFRNGNWAL
jgi:aminopeptidase